MNFVTGATGIIGSRIVYDLLIKGEEVLALKRKDSNLDSLKRLFEFWNNQESLFDKINWVEGDVSDIYSILDPVSHSNKVYHTAALVSFHRKDARDLMEVNVRGTANMVNAALNSEVEKFVHVSSTAALGRTKSGVVIDENSDWKDSSLNTRYAESKYKSENEVWRAQQEGLDVAIVNPAIVLGPGEEGKSSGAIFSTLKKGMKFYPKGKNAFVSSYDVSRACIDLMNSDIVSERFVMAAENLSYREVFSRIAKEFGNKAPDTEVRKWMLQAGRIFLGLREFFGGPKSSITKETVMTSGKSYSYDSSKIISQLDFEFKGIDIAIEDTVKFMKLND